MKTITKFMIFNLLLLGLSGCTGSGSDGPVGKSKLSKKKSNNINDIVAEIVNEDDGTIDLIADALDEEENFSYQLDEILLQDYQSIARLALNHMRSDLSQDSVLYQQGKVSGNIFEPLELIRVNIDTQSQQVIPTTITEQYHYIRGTTQDDVYYVITRYPIKLYKVDAYNEIISDLGELFTDSNLQSNKRILNRIHNYKNNLCGLHTSSTNALFHKNAIDEVRYFSANGSVSNIFCLEKGLVELTSDGDYYWHNESTSSFVFSASANSCTSVKVVYREDGFYFLCYYLDSNNKNRYYSYHVNESTESLEQKSLAPAVSTALSYIIKADLVNARHGKSELVLHYRTRTENQWNKIYVETKANSKNVLTMNLNQGELQLMSHFAFYSLKENLVIKTPLAFHPKTIWNVGLDNFILSHVGAVHKLDLNNEVNDYYYNITKDENVEEINPAPFLNITDKVSVLRADTNENKVTYFSKVGTIFKAYEQDVVDSTLSVHEFNVGDLILDLVSNTEYHFVVLRQADGNYYLNIYDLNFNVLQSHMLSGNFAKYTKISLVSDGLIVSDRRELAKYDFDLIKKWSRPITSITSERIVEAPNKKLIGVFNGFVVAINPNDGSFEEVFNLIGLGFNLTYDLILDGDRHLFINYRGDRVFKIKLPHSLITL
jgi:predicted cupin superfamily sugar epimerase